MSTDEIDDVQIISTRTPEEDQTTSTFLREKLANFQQFLIENLPNPGLRAQVAQITGLSMPLIHAWIVDELAAQPDLREYVNKLFVKYEIDHDSVPPHVVDKVQRYFECFISCV